MFFKLFSLIVSFKSFSITFLTEGMVIILYNFFLVCKGRVRHTIRLYFPFFSFEFFLAQSLVFVISV